MAGSCWCYRDNGRNLGAEAEVTEIMLAVPAGATQGLYKQLFRQAASVIRLVPAEQSLVLVKIQVSFCLQEL